MRGRRSPGTGRRYPLTMICATYRLARSSVYAGPAAAPRERRGKRGPKTSISDAALLTEIRAVLAACPFHGEGYRKVRARLAHRGSAASGKRVLRRMRAPPAGAAPPRPAERQSGARWHDHDRAA